MAAPAILVPAPKGGRLGNGQLRRQVAEWLAARPGPHTVGEVAKALGRSAGAVGNALATLADRNEADRDPGKSARYWANAKTGACRLRRPRRSRPRQPRQRRRPRRRPPPAGQARPGHPPRRAGLPAPRTRRHGRRRGAAHAARRGRPRPAVRAARHRQDEPGRGGLPRPDHGGRGRRHHGGRLRRRVHPAPRRHLRVHLRPPDQAMQEGRVLFIPWPGSRPRGNLATRQANGETGWAPQLRELLAFAKVTRIFGLDTALANLAGVAPAEDRDLVADTLAKTFGKTVTPLKLGRQI